MPPRNLGNRNPGSERLGDDPPLLLHRPAPAASYPGANVHPPARELRVAYSVAHMCETFPPNQQETCNIPRASIKVGWENRLRSIEPFFMSLAARDSEFRRWSGRVDRRICQTFAASPAEPGELPLGFRAAQRATAKFFARGVRSEQSGWSRGERPMTVGTPVLASLHRRLCPVLAVRPDGANPQWTTRRVVD